MAYPESANIFPNRLHWDESGHWVSARNDPAVCWCPEDTPPSSNLCEQCQEIDLRHLILCEAQNRTVHLGTLATMIKRPNCDLCSLFALGSKPIWRGSIPWEDVSTGATTECYFYGLVPERQQPRGYALQISETHPWQWPDFEIFLKGYNATSKQVERSLKTFPRVDFGFLKSMLGTCEDNHDECKTEAPTTPEDMSVIDLENMSIVSAPKTCRYFALSYVWGKVSESWLVLTRANSSLLSMKGSLLQASLPQTIRDAIQLCLELNERYLWVDSLCIIQDDPEIQKNQIDIMDTIYASAVLTIVAAGGDHANAGLPGVSTWLRAIQHQTITIGDIDVSNILPRLKDTVDISIWNTRGWTYQERVFSRRCIYLTEAQAYYACPQRIEYEVKDRLLPHMWSSLESFKTTTTKQTFLEIYSRHVTNYSRRSLTSQADILRAFQGVMNSLSRRFGQTFYYGLPNKKFDDALLWQSAGHAARRVVAGMNLPSWS